jgi:predicted RNase H-like nuclease (RuvC/YqgF family)
MKKKNLYKLIKKAISEANNERYPKDTTEERQNDALFSDPSEESKIKVRNLIIRLSSRRDELEYNINENTINIYKYQENVPTNKSNNYFNIQIIKEVGFIINFNERRILMKDPTLYTEMKEEIKKISDGINQDNFIQLYNAVMKESGLNRESNLDELLTGL